MSLMLRLLAIIVLANSASCAGDMAGKVETFIENSLDKNPNIDSLSAKVIKETGVEGYKEWRAFFVQLSAVLKKDKREVGQKMIWLSNGEIVSKEIFDLETGENLSDLVSLPFEQKYYTRANLIYGNPSAKHKVAIFSDPLCPFCKKFVPEAIKYMKKEPNKYALYYYHFPLESLHPAAVELIKAAIALELKGRKDVILDLYKIKIDPKERSNEKILAVFNKTMHSNIKMHELLSKEVSAHLKNDLNTANAMMVNGTPTVFFDGKLDKTKNRYKEAK